MATDFKPPKKYIFDHYIKSVVGPDLGISPVPEQKTSDQLRILLNLIYDQEYSPLSNPAAAFFTPLEKIFENYLQLNLSQGKFQITPSVEKNAIPSNDQKALLEFLEQFQKDNLPTGLAGEKKVYEDFNFSPENQQAIDLSVRTITRKLNSLDIKETDAYFTNGELVKDKEETSLKFAYAFRTTTIQGESEVISKQVSLTPDAINLQKFARNQNDNVKTIDKLKNLIYFGSESKDIEKILIGEGSIQDIEIDKIYNLLTISLPEQSPSDAPLNDLNSIWPYITSNKTPLMNQLSYPPIDNVGDLLPLIDDYYKYLCLSYFVKLLDSENSFNDIKNLKIVTPEGQVPFNITSYGLDKQEAENFSKNLSDEIKKLTLKNSLFKSEIPKTNQLVKDLVFGDTGIFSNRVNLITENAQKILGVQGLSQLYALGTSTPAFYDSISLFVNNKFKKPLLNYSMSEVFTGAFKHNNKFIFNKGSVQKNLLRKGRLVGLRLVKSLTPLDPSLSASPSNILQVFHIPVQLTPQGQQIRLFDSQIVYGQDYFYTIYGVYSVDGKYYFYDDIKKKIVDLVVGEKESEVDIFENKIFENIDETLTKDAINKLKLIGIDESNDKNDAAVYLNPCCQYRDGKFVNIGSTTGTGKGSNPDDEFWGVAPPPWSRPGYAEELEKRVEDLVSAAKSGIFSKTDELNKAVKKLKNSPYSDAISCWICQRRSEGGGQSILAYLLGKFFDGQDKILLNALNCKKYGYSSSQGNVTKSTTANSSLIADSGLGKPGTIAGFDPKKKCTKQEKVKVGTKTITETVTTQVLEKFEFSLKESNATKIFDIPLKASVESSVVDVPPIAPVVTFVPLADINNRIKIKFQEAVQSDFAIVEIDEAIKTFNNAKLGLKATPLFTAIVLKSKEIAKEEGIILPNDSILAKSQGDLAEIHVRKLDRRPTNLQDLIDNGEEFILDFLNGKTAYFSNLKPNQKYYYTFVSRDITGLYSSASATYVVEIVEDSGFVYTKIGIYEYPSEQEQVSSKHFQKLLKITPSFEELLPVDATRLGTNDLYSTITNNSSSSTVEQPPKFKIRIRSKKTKRMFDINIKYTQDVKEITSKRLLKQIKKFSELVDKKVETK